MAKFEAVESGKVRREGGRKPKLEESRPRGKGRPDNWGSNLAIGHQRSLGPKEHVCPSPGPLWAMLRVTVSQQSWCLKSRRSHKVPNFVFWNKTRGDAWAIPRTSLSPVNFLS